MMVRWLRQLVRSGELGGDEITVIHRRTLKVVF